MPPKESTFPGTQRIHIGLSVSNVARSIDFYAAMFGQPPVKIRAGYAKFEPDDPSVNLSLNEVKAVLPANPESHFGIQVKSSEQLAAMTQRLRSAGLSLEFEKQVTCCYAVQDKIWARDPDGHAWEVFRVTQDDTATATDLQGSGEADCCAPKCCEGSATTNANETNGNSKQLAPASCCGTTTE